AARFRAPATWTDQAAEFFGESTWAIAPPGPDADEVHLHVARRLLADQGGGREPGFLLDRLIDDLDGLDEPVIVEPAVVEAIAGRPAAHTILRGAADGTDVEVYLGAVVFERDAF